MKHWSSVVDRLELPPASDRDAWFLALAVVLLHVGLAWQLRTPGLGWGEDDSAYLLLGSALRGFSYRELQDVAAPMHAKYPPLFPMLIAIVGGQLGAHIDRVLLFVGLCSALSLLFFYDVARRLVGNHLALLATFLFAINPSALWDAGNIMSEALFKLLFMVAIWGLTRERDGDRYSWVAIAAVVLAALTRTVGSALIISLGAYWLVRRRIRWVAALAAASTPAVAWIWFSLSAPNPQDSRLYVADLMAGSDDVTGALVLRLRGVVQKLRAYATVYVPTAIAVPTVRGTIVDNLVTLALVAAAGITGAAALVRPWPGGLALVSGYGLLLMVWTFGFTRLVHPIVAPLYLLVLTGSAVLGRALFPFARRAVLYAMTVMLVVGAVQRDRTLWHRVSDCDRADPSNAPGCWRRNEREFLRLAYWVRDSTPPGSVILTGKERAFYVHAGRRSVNEGRALREGASDLAAWLRANDVRYATVTPVSPRSRLSIGRLADACQQLVVAHQISITTMLLEVRSTASGADRADACRAIAAAAPRLGGGE